MGSKTLEVIFVGDKKKIVSPDHDESLLTTEVVFDFPTKYARVCDDVMAVDIPTDMYFHLEGDEDSVIVTRSDFPQMSIRTYMLPYLDGYTFGEKVTELGVPDTKNGRDAFTFKYMPHLALEMSFKDSISGSSAEPTGVKINGTVYDLVERT